MATGSLRVAAAASTVCIGVLALAWLCLLAGCGGAAPNNGDPGGDDTDTMPAEEREAAEEAAGELAAAIPDDVDVAEANQLLATQMAALPGFVRAEAYGEGGSGGVIAEFLDGQPYVIVNDARSDQTDVELSVESIGARAVRSGVPHGRKALLVRAMGPAFVDIRNTLRTMLEGADYDVTLQDGTIENLAAVRSPDVFYFDTHGVYQKDWGGAGKDLAAAWTSTPRPNAAYEPLCAGATPQLVRMTALDSRDAHGNAVNAQRYGITAEFLRARGVSFAAGSLVYMDCCFLDIGPFKAQCLATNASLYVGWTDAVRGGSAARAALFGFDRMLGANSGSPTREEPDQRPFDYARVWNELQSKGWDRSDSAVLKYTPGTADTGMLAPSIRYLSVEETFDTGAEQAKLTIDGMFGQPNEDNCTVTVGGTQVEVTQFGSETLECAIPDSGGGSSGDVVVEVYGHESNPVPLTDWRGEIEYTMRLKDEPLQYQITVGLHLRGDIHPHRDRPAATPSYPIVTLTPVGDSTCTYECSGTTTAGEATITWAGAGEIPYRSMSGHAGQDNWLAPVTISTYGDGSPSTARVHFHAWSAAGLASTVTHPEYTTTVNYPIMAPFREDGMDDTGRYVDLELDGQYGIPQFRRVGLTEDAGGEPADWIIEWETISATNQPDPEAHPSSLSALPMARFLMPFRW